MKSILEKALVHLLNEDHEKANELMHQFVVESAREIHESLREGDEEFLDELEEGDEFFTEADLAELDDEEAADNLADDLDVAGTEDGGVEAEDFEVSGDDTEDFGLETAEIEGSDDLGEVEAEEGSIEDKIDHIEDELEAMQAEFDRILAEFEAEGDEGAEEAESDIVDAEDGAEEEEYEDITESMVDELKKVTASNQENRGATGEKLGGGTTSVVARDAKPAAVKTRNGVGHTGFDREKAPTSKAVKRYDNIRSKATDGTSKVDPKGPKGAELSKPVAGNTKSVIGGKKAK